MARRKPPHVTTHGDGRRLSSGVGAFLVELFPDRRVQTFHDTWRGDHHEGGQRLDAFLRQCQPDPRKQDQPLTLEQSATVRRFLEAAKASERRHLADALAPVLHRLPPAWLPMLTENLLLAFHTVEAWHRTDPDQRPALPYFGIGVQLTAAHRRGRVPHDPAPVARNMHWLYRHYVPEQTDALPTLGRELAAATGHDEEDCRRQVADGIAQGWALLDLAARSAWSPTVPGRIVVPEPPPEP